MIQLKEEETAIPDQEFEPKIFLKQSSMGDTRF